MIISKTPLRASLFGGGSDFKAYFENSVMGYGSVLSAGLNMLRYVWYTTEMKMLILWMK